MQATMQSKWWKRPLALMLSLALVVSSLVGLGVPEQVHAASDEVYVSNNGDDNQGDGSQEKPYATLQTAYQKVNTGGTIYILDNITLSHPFPKFDGKNVTITTAPDAPEIAVIQRGAVGGSGTGTLFDLNNGSFVLKNIIIDGSFGEGPSEGRLLNVNGNAKLIIEDGTILRNNYSKYPGSAVILNAASAVVEMTGGEIIGNKQVSSGAIALNVSGAKFTMTGGKITGNSGGGVHVRDNITGNIILSDDAVITENTIGESERNVYLEDANLLTLSGNFTGKAGITAEGRMTAGKQFGKATASGLTGLENLIADNNPHLFAVYGESDALVWQLPPSLEITAPSGNEVYESQPTFEGTTDAGATVTVEIKDKDGNVIDTPAVTINDDGTWSFTPTSELGDGEYTVAVTATKNGKTSTATKNVTVNTTLPSLVITEPSGNEVYEPQPTFKGTTDAGATVTVQIKDKDGNVVDQPTVTVNPDGTWSFTPTPELGDGEYTVAVTATKNGKTSTETKDIKVTAPAPLATPSNVQVTENKLTWDKVENADKYVVTIKLKDGTEITKETTNASLDLSALNPSLAPGECTVTVTAKSNNPAYTDSEASKPVAYEFKVDKSALQTEIKRAKALNESNYTTGSWSAFKTELDKAQSVFDDPNATQSQVDKALQDLKKAMDNLVRKGGGGGGSTSPTTPEAPKDNLDVTLNGNDNKFATGTVSTSDGRTTTSVEVDQGKLIDAISQGTGQKLAIHSPNEGEMKVQGLTAEVIKQLSDKRASLEISNPLAIYPIPGGNVHLSAVASELGNAKLSDIDVRIDIHRSPEDLIVSAKNKATAEGYELLVDPVDLDLIFSHGDKSVRSSQLNGYAAKYIALPQGIDPNRITTGVIINPDGSVYHVPTIVTKMNNRYFAQINDLRSSGTYSVIWNPKDFDDVRSHWAREDVNNIAARLDLEGNGYNKFSPDRSITRSEFTKIVVTGLGLMRPDTQKPDFSDVPSSAWDAKAVAIANEFGIVSGYEDGNFYGSQQITRVQGFSMLARAYRLIQSEDKAGQDVSVLAEYKDGKSIPNWAREDVAQLIEAGIIKGNGSKFLSPQATMTRAEMTTLIARMLKITNMIDK